MKGATTKVLLPEWVLKTKSHERNRKNIEVHKKATGNSKYHQIHENFNYNKIKLLKQLAAWAQLQMNDEIGLSFRRNTEKYLQLYTVQQFSFIFLTKKTIYNNHLTFKKCANLRMNMLLVEKVLK